MPKLRSGRSSAKAPVASKRERSRSQTRAGKRVHTDSADRPAREVVGNEQSAAQSRVGGVPSVGKVYPLFHYKEYDVRNYA